VERLAIIVPYRDRQEQLDKFTTFIQQYLQNRKYDYFLIVVEQDDDKPFNRGKLLNIGFTEAQRRRCDYVVFHDVDMLPIDVNYGGIDYPVHLATDLLPFEEYFGGITLFPTPDFERINGFSNNYWGWGFEDDDLMHRCIMNNLKLNTIKKEVVIPPRTDLKFNGANAYIEMLNPINIKDSFSIILEFVPEKNFFNHRSDSDKFSLFSIPGFDFSISYTSFNRYKLEFFDSLNNYHQIFSDISNIRNLPTKLFVTYSKQQQLIYFYLNNKLVGKIEVPHSFYNYNEESKAYIGSSKGTESFFKGTINNIAFYKSYLNKKQLNSIFENKHYSLSQEFEDYSDSHFLTTYYDTKFVKDYKTIDLSGNNNLGRIFNCEITKSSNKLRDIQYIPYRRSSKIKHLVHDNNGFTDGNWKDKMTRWNQLKYHNEVSKGFHDIDKDGINSLDFKLNKRNTTNKYIHLNVEL
jgi:hypothetical protein